MVITSTNLHAVATPLEFAELAGYEVTHTPDGQYVRCPVCTHELWLVNSSFFCQNNSCPFLVGNVFEFAAWLHGRSYEQAFDLLQEIYPKRFTHLALGPELLRSQAARHAQREREILECFIRATQQQIPLSNEVSGLADFYLQSHIDPTVLRLSAAAMDQSQLEQLRGALAAQDVDMPDLSERCYLAVPFFENHHRLDAILLLNPFANQAINVRLSRSRFSYSGLWMQRDPSHEIVLHRSPLSALEAMSRAKPNQVHLGYSINSKQHTFQPCARRSLFLVTRIGDLPAAAQYQEAAPESRFAEEAEFLEPLPWVSFLDRKLERSLHPVFKHLTSETYATLDAVKLTDAQLTDLITRAHSKKLTNLATELERIRSAPIIYDGKGCSIQQTNEGYVATYPGVAQRDGLSNFTVQFDYTASFVDRQALFYKGRVRFKGKEYPIMLPQTSLTSLRQLCDEAQRRVALAEGSNEQGIPFLSTAPAVKHLQTHWMRELGQLPCRPGIPFLGWDGRRESFYSPTWHIGMDGIYEEIRPFHPDVLVLDCYRQENLPEVAGSGLDLPAELCDLISMIVGSIVRGRLHYPVRPIEFHQDSNAQRIFDAIFRALGQIRPVVNPTAMKGLQLYPAYTNFLLSRSQVDSLPQPIFCLSPNEGAIHFREVPSDQQLDQAAAVLQRMIFRSCELLLASSAADLGAERVAHVFYSAQVCQEGCRWIRRHLSLPDWKLGRQPLHHLQGVIQSLAPKKLGDVIRYLPGSDPRALLRMDRLSGDLVDLELELRYLDTTLRIENGCFSLAYQELARLLQTYYGQFMALPTPDESWLPEVSADVE